MEKFYFQDPDHKTTILSMSQPVNEFCLDNRRLTLKWLFIYHYISSCVKTTDRNSWAETKAPLRASGPVSRNYRENEHGARWFPPSPAAEAKSWSLRRTQTLGFQFMTKELIIRLDLTP